MARYKVIITTVETRIAPWLKSIGFNCSTYTRSSKGKMAVHVGIGNTQWLEPQLNRVHFSVLTIITYT
jgi:hypothetical protein